MKPYNPRWEVRDILKRALTYVNSVPYGVTARWVFYRLLQDGTLKEKEDYKRLLSYLSNARKRFYGGWHPSTLVDESRSALVYGSGFDDGNQWLRSVQEKTTCSMDKWQGQPNYVEIWFEAAAMQAQFEFHAHRYMPLLAFKGDISIPAKWDAAVRIADRWLELHVPVKILYYGDLDDKGIMIPETAERDVYEFVAMALYERLRDMDGAKAEFHDFSEGWEFIRMGLNEDQIGQYNVPENPERPGTYQWEGLEDDDARQMIEAALVYIDEDAFLEAEQRGEDITSQFQDHIGSLVLDY